MDTLIRHVLFVQGGGKGTHDAWDNKLVASLKKALGSGYSVHYPRMPDEDSPDAAAWKKEIARALSKLGDAAILVGHSVGGAILVDYLADGDPDARPAAVFLVAAPFIGDGGWPSGDLRPTREAAAKLPAALPLYLYRGDDDDTVPSSHLEMFAKALPRAIVRRLEGRDHQLNDDLSEVAHDIKQASVPPPPPPRA
jgi:predicted alpha/beta hydrolase family esterase